MSIPITNILNVRYGLRKLLQNPTHHASEAAIPKSDLEPAKEPAIRAIIADAAAAIVRDPTLLLVDRYTPQELRKDWEALVKKAVLEGGEIVPMDSRSRPGHKLLDHYMPHFFAVTNHRGTSVQSMITQEALEKALLANLAMHSTPYKSEIRRMLVMTAGLSNVTKYRAIVAKGIVEFYSARYAQCRVLDPCIGWGGRMLGALAAGTEYVGCEPDPNTVRGLRGILADPALPTSVSANALVVDQPVEAAWATLRERGPYQMILTSPPYFNLELYTAGEQSVARFPTWSQWVAGWLKPVILGCLGLLEEGGVSCWSVKNIRTDREYPLATEVHRIHEEAGWELRKTVTLRGSARPGAGRVAGGKETRESEEETYCFMRKV